MVDALVGVWWDTGFRFGIFNTHAPPRSLCTCALCGDHTSCDGADLFTSTPSPQRRTPPMPSLTPLQQLCRLNSSSPDQFPEQLTSLLRQRGYREGVTSLQDEDLLQLVEHLDHVCLRVTFTDPLPKPTQVLGTLHPASPAFWKCLREVRAICGNRKVLPQSHRLSHSLLSTAEWPIASRGPCDVYEGLLDGLKVSVKRLRIYSRERPKDIQHVCHRHLRLP